MRRLGTGGSWIDRSRPIAFRFDGVEYPAFAGDTLFADAAAAYDNLADDDRALVDRLDARHDWSIGEYATKYGEQLDHFRALHPPVVHPMAIAHPRTGRSTLFVNALFTAAVVGIEPDEGSGSLERLVVGIAVAVAFTASLFALTEWRRVRRRSPSA